MDSSTGFPIKLSYNGETRKFMLKENGNDYEQLIAHAQRLFPSLSDATLGITYVDEDGDCITISTADEFQLALLHSQTTKFNVTTASASTSKTAAPHINDAVHDHVTCDDCGMYPIVGDRFKCSLRRDFDLCSACESKTIQPYPMLKIYNPQQSPASLIVTLHDGQFEHERVDGDVSLGNNEVYVDARPVAPEVCAAPGAGGSGRGCGQQGRKLFRCGGRGRQRPLPRHHNAPVPPHAPGSCHPQGPPFHHGPPPGRGRGGWRGPFGQPFQFPFTHPFSRRQQQQRQQDTSTQDAGRDESSSASLNLKSEEMKENLANVVSSVFTGVASMVNSTLHEESQPTTTASESTSNPQESNRTAAKQAAANAVSSIFTNVANLARDAVRNSSPNHATATTSSAPMVPQSPFQPKVQPKAVLVEDVTFPPNSTVPAGASFVKIWRVQNTGEESWPKDLHLEVCGTDYIFSNPSKDLGELTVAPGESVDLSITLIAPAEIGTCVEYFVLRDNSSIIGPYLCVDIQVVEGGEMGDWNLITPTAHTEETCEVNDAQDDAIQDPFSSWKLHMADLDGYVHFYDTNGDTIFQLAFDNNFLTMNSCVQSEWGGAEFVPIDPKQLPFEAAISINEKGFEISFEGPKRYIFRDGKHHLEAGENIVYMYNHRVPIRFFRGDVKTSGDRYNVIRVSSKQQNNSEPVCNDSMSLENAHLQEEMYSRYASEIQYLADMGFTNFAVLFPILKAMVPVPASETESGEVSAEQINEVVAMLVARTS